MIFFSVWRTQGMLSRNIPIDGVGLQFHWSLEHHDRAYYPSLPSGIVCYGDCREHQVPGKIACAVQSANMPRVLLSSAPTCHHVSLGWDWLLPEHHWSYGVAV